MRVDAIPVDDSALGELLGREPREQVHELLVQLVLLAATQRRRVPDVRQLTRARLRHTRIVLLQVQDTVTYVLVSYTTTKD